MGTINEHSKIIDMVLLLMYGWAVDDFYAPLVAAFHEVEAFYNKKEKLAEFRYHYISEYEPKHPSKDFSHIQCDVKSILKEAEDFIDTYDAFTVASLVKNMLSEQQVVGSLVIVIDQLLTPPKNWRYIIWSNGVISIMPLDPQFWTTRVYEGEEQELDRMNIIKHRVRTACLSNVGTSIGLRPCNDEHCFLYHNIDSFMRLDKMVKLGPNHDLSYLENLGFDVFSRNPERENQVRENPKWWMGFYESE